VKRIFKWLFRIVLLLLLVAFIWIEIAYWRSTNDCFRSTAAPIHPMKAVRYCEYGVANVKLQDVEKPVPNDDQVLVKVRAASLNALDVGVTRDSWLGRLFFGLRKPRDTRLGQDLAGVVEAIGKNVTLFKPGDEVFGVCRGGLAEYTCTREQALAPKPPNLTFEQAASLPLAGSIALQGLREGKIQPGQKVLINGATGGVGTFAVQIAKSLGAEVTAVCSTRNVDLVKSIGADHVIDYTKEDFTKGDQRYDVIFDDLCNHSFSERSRVLTPKGICVLAGVGGAGVTSDQAIGRIASNLLIAGARSSFTDQKFPSPTLYRIKTSKDDLITVGELVASGKIKPVVERTYKLSDAPEAMRYLEQGHARGKVVIAVE
jgi:NADPH:quinone reductase-like Zn-dependent oxidoreductase